jgi:hypothetical protein
VKIRIGTLVIALTLGISDSLLPASSQAAEASNVRTRAEQSFDWLKPQSGEQRGRNPADVPAQVSEGSDDGYPSDRYWVGKGQGDLSKGKAVCQRVSELSARTDLAKQIRVMVKEHMVDRVRERSGHEPEQDIELTREEIVQEYLQGVKIVNHGIDEESKTCTATAVMPKNQAQLKLGAGSPELQPEAIR